MAVGGKIEMEAPPLERKLVAILAADVEGYSRLMHEDEERTLAKLTSHRLLIDELIAGGRGELSSTAGDSVLAEFASVVDATHTAVAIQQALRKANEEAEPEQPMEFRIGINIGDVMVKDGGIFGDGVNVAARLEALADPGGICVTRGVRDQLRDRTAYSFEDLGEHSVKNIARPVRAFRVVFDRTAAPVLEEARSPVPASTPPLNSSGEEPHEVEVAFWKSVEESGKHEEYREYLRQYPTGAFVALAQARLQSGTLKPPAVDRAVELSFWESVKESQTSPPLKAYLEKYPDGEFRALAELRLAELEDR
jgi:adenylate cyclase